ncbi:hypothetical protein OH77DRAFT_874162 [Trametes cingulata]|nr:hypothetical protein OH77DRAFT_874162 [Trametes cingulata]
MIIRNVPVRQRTALLKPECVELKGYLIEDRDKDRDQIFFRALKARLGCVPNTSPPPAYSCVAHREPVEEPLPPRAPSPPPEPPQALRSPLREISPPPPGAEAGPSGSPRRVEREHDDDAGQPRRRKRPSRAGRSPSPDPPPREVVLQRSRYFSKPPSGVSSSAGRANSLQAGAEVDMDEDVGRVRVDSGDADAMQNLARAIGLSPQRPAPAPIPLHDSDNEDPFGAGSNDHTSTKSNGNGKGKEKQRAEPVFGEPGSEDYGFEFEMDDSFLEQVDRVEQEALLRAAASNLEGRANGSQAQAQSQTLVASVQTHTHTQIKAEPRSQSASRTLFGAGSQRPLPRPIARAGSAAAGPGTSSSGSGADVPMDMIDISDDEVDDKENVPVPTRHVRRRVALPADADVIELSD